MYGHVITKFSQMGSLLHFLTHHGCSTARFARESSAISQFHKKKLKNLNMFSKNVVSGLSSKYSSSSSRTLRLLAELQ